jgi:hypothetical protein
MSARVIVYLILLLSITLFGSVKFKKLALPFKHLVVLIGLTFVSECISRYLVFTIRNSNPPYHIFCIVEFVLLCRIYAILIISIKIKRLVNIAIFIFPIFSVANTILFQGLFTFPNNVLLLSYTIVLMLALVLFLQMLHHPQEDDLLKQPVFWFNSGIAVFCASVFLTLGFYNYFLRHHISNTLISTVNYGINILFYMVLWFSIWLNGKSN